MEGNIVEMLRQQRTVVCTPMITATWTLDGAATGT